MRKRLFEIIELSDEGDKFSKCYDVFMMLVIIASIIPLCFTTQNIILIELDKISAFIFIVDYIFRFVTADFVTGKGTLLSFITYPLRPLAIIDLLSILPSITSVNRAFKVFKVFRLFKIFRIFKFVRYSKNIRIICNVLKRKKDALMTVGIMAVAYILVSALIIFQIEPDTFNNFFGAVYWATVSLTTVGYGDIYPVSSIGRFISMLSSFFGIAIVALPSGIIISAYQEELDKQTEK